MIEQPFDGTRSAPGHAVINLFQLLSDVQMQRRIWRKRHEGGELLRRDGAQAMRRDAHSGSIQSPHRAATRLEESCESVEIVDEAALPRPGRHAAEVTVRVEDRQQREPNAGILRRCSKARGEFTQVGVRFAAAIMMQVMKFTDSREARLQHLGKRKGADRLYIFRTQAFDKAVHEVAPGPETIGTRPRILCQSGHRALEGMTMHIGQSGQRDGMPLIVRAGFDTHLDSVNAAGLDAKTHFFRPTGFEQRGAEPQIDHSQHPPAHSMQA